MLLMLASTPPTSQHHCSLPLTDVSLTNTFQHKNSHFSLEPPNLVTRSFWVKLAFSIYSIVTVGTLQLSPVMYYDCIFFLICINFFFFS